MRGEKGCTTQNERVYQRDRRIQEVLRFVNCYVREIGRRWGLQTVLGRSFIAAMNRVPKFALLCMFANKHSCFTSYITEVCLRTGGGSNHEKSSCKQMSEDLICKNIPQSFTAFPIAAECAGGEAMTCGCYGSRYPHPDLRLRTLHDAGDEQRMSLGSFGGSLGILAHPFDLPPHQSGKGKSDGVNPACLTDIHIFDFLKEEHLSLGREAKQCWTCLLRVWTRLPNPVVIAFLQVWPPHH